MIPLLLLTLSACEQGEVCFGSCECDPGEYSGIFYARVVGEYEHDCWGHAALVVDDGCTFEGEMSCGIFDQDEDDYGGPLTGRITGRQLAGLWVPSWELWNEVYSWQVPVQGTNAEEAIHATFALDTEWIDVEDGSLEVTIE